MFGIPVEYLGPIATLLGLAVIGAFAEVGRRWGVKNPPPTDRAVEVAGALVDSSSVRMLTAAIEAHTLEAMTGRQDAEKARQVAYRLVDALVAISNHLESLDDSVRDMTKEIVRGK